jgi:hypothetical protein
MERKYIMTFDELVSGAEKTVANVAQVIEPFFPQAAAAPLVVDALGSAAVTVDGAIEGDGTTTTTSTTVTSPAAATPTLVPVETAISPALELAAQNVTNTNIADTVLSSNKAAPTAPEDTTFQQFQQRIAQLEHVVSILAPVVGTLVPSAAPLIKNTISDAGQFRDVFNTAIADAAAFKPAMSRILSFFDTHLQGKV